jgi:hypothetical protein
MNEIRTKELYSSPNGDRWHLCKDGIGRLFVQCWLPDTTKLWIISKLPTCRPTKEGC